MGKALRILFIFVLCCASLPAQILQQILAPMPSASVNATLIQSKGCPSSLGAGGTPISSTPDYYCPLNEPAQTSNTLVVFFSGAGEPTADLTVKACTTNSCSTSDTLTIASGCSATDSNSPANTYWMAYKVGISNADRVIDIHSTTGGSGYWVPQAQEWANLNGFDKCATHSPTSASTSITSGSLTPAGSGEELIQAAFSGDKTAQTSVYTVGSQSNITWAFMNQMLPDGYAVQYGTYNSSSAITPTFTAATSDIINSIAAAFTVGTQGSVPSSSLTRVENTEDVNVSTNSFTVGFPSRGNMVVIDINTANLSAAPTSSPSNTWVLANRNTYSVEPGDQWVCSPCTTSTNMTISLTTTMGANNPVYFFRDIANGPTSQVVNQASGGNYGSQSSTPSTFTTEAPFNSTSGYTGGSVTANASNLLVTGTGNWQNCTATSPATGATSGILFDAAYYTGNDVNGPQNVDQNSEAYHYYSGSSGQQLTATWNMLCGSNDIGDWGTESTAWNTANAGVGLTSAVQTVPCRGTTATITCSITIANSGDSLVAVGGGYRSGGSFSVTHMCTDGTTCAAGNVFTQDASVYSSTPHGLTAAFHLFNQSGTKTVTITNSAAPTNGEWTIYEVPVITAVDGTPVTTTNKASVGGIDTTGSVTTTSTNGFCAAYVTTTNGVTSSPENGTSFYWGTGNAGWLVTGLGTFGVFPTTSNAAAALVSQSSGSISASFTDTSGATFGSVLSCYK